MAAAFYNQITRTNDADSAGTEVLPPGKTLGERAEAVGAADKLLEAMDEVGIDMRPKVRTQLTEEMMKNYDVVINMADVEKMPEFLENYPNAVRWEIEDPRDKNADGLRRTRDEIRAKVQGLIAKA